jgi:hypothetical protein
MPACSRTWSKSNTSTASAFASVSTTETRAFAISPMLKPLLDPAYFARAFIEMGALTWPNGFDYCPDYLHQQMEAAGELRNVLAR